MSITLITNTCNHPTISTPPLVDQKIYEQLFASADNDRVSRFDFISHGWKNFLFMPKKSAKTHKFRHYLKPDHATSISKSRVCINIDCIEI